MLGGIHLNLLIGPTVPIPAPPTLLEKLESVQVTTSDEGRSGFQLVFHVGRSGPADVVDYPLLLNPLVKPFNRVIITVLINAIPHVLIDGIITHHQLNPSNDPGGSTLTITGEDVSVMMDMEERKVEHPAMDETLQAFLTIARYAQYQLLPLVTPPPTLDPPNPVERTPVQYKTDLKHLQDLAEPHGYVFYVTPGPVPLTNFAYWGPPKRTDLPQRALSVNMGPETNVDSINFSYNGLAPTTVAGEVQDRTLNVTLPFETFISLRLPLVPFPALPFNLPNVRKKILSDTEGLNYLQAFAKAQGMTDKSLDGVVSASGELDAARYGGILRARGVVGLRGAGFTYDGFYYVKSVTHTIKKGTYKQSFSLTREGVGAISPVVIP